MKYLFSYTILTLLSAVCLAQPYGDAEFKKKFNKADALVYDGAYMEALPLLEDMYAYDTSNANLNYLLGVSYLMGKKDHGLAIKRLESATKDVSLEHSEANWKERKAPGKAYYYLGRAYHFKNKFDRAVTNYYNYRSFIEMDDVETYNEVRHQIQYAENAMELIKKPVGVKVTNLGPEINTKYPEYCPVVSADGKVLIFTSRREHGTGDGMDQDGLYFEDIYVCQKQPNGKWSKPQSIGSNINSTGHEAAIGLSPDGQLLFIYKNDDIFQSKKTSTGWSDLEPLGSDINSPSWETHASVTATGDLLVFTSNRSEGGYGGRDLWYCKKLPNGDWGLAMNMGSVINTDFEEDSPFISADGNTLIFSSQGHTSMGGFDIFRSEFVDGAWSNPENIGYPINTAEDDVFFVLTPDGRHAYYSSRMDGGYGDTDLYMLKLEVKKASGLAVARGVMKVPAMAYADISARIEVTDGGGALVGTYRPNPATGFYVLVLDPGETYNISYEADGYDRVTAKLPVADDESYQDYDGVIELDEVVFGENILALQKETERLENETEKAKALAAEQERLASEAALKAQEDVEAIALAKAREEERKKAEELAAKQKAEAQAALAQQQEKAKQAEIERKKAEAKAKFIAQQELAAKQKAEEERLNAEKEAKAKEEEEALAQAAREKAEEERRIREEQEALAKAEAARLKQEEEIRLKAEAEAKVKEEQEALAKAAAEAARLKAEEEAKAKVAQQLAVETEVAAVQEAKGVEADENVEAEDSLDEVVQEVVKKEPEIAKAQEIRSSENEEVAANSEKLEDAAENQQLAEQLAEEQAKRVAEAEAKRLALQKRIQELKERQESEQQATAEIQEEKEVKEVAVNLVGNAVSEQSIDAQSIEAKRQAMLARIEELKKRKTEVEQQKVIDEAAIAEATRKEKEALAKKQQLESKSEQTKEEIAELQKELQVVEGQVVDAQQQVEAAREEALVAEQKLAADIEEEKRIAEEEKKKKEEAAEAARQLKELEELERKRIEQERLAAEQFEREQREEAERTKRELIQLEALAEQQAQVQAALQAEERKKKEIEAAERTAYSQQEILDNATTIDELRKLNSQLISDNLELKKQLSELNAKLDLILARLDYQPDIEKVEIPASSTMKSLQEGKRLILRNIFFDYNQATLRSKSKYELNKLYDFLKANPSVKIEVSGHTDSRGNDDYNLRLSRDRAQAVVDYLIRNGVASSRLKAVGYGETRPIARNENPDLTDNPIGRQLNRRIEISIPEGKVDGVEVEEIQVPSDARIR